MFNEGGGATLTFCLSDSSCSSWGRRNKWLMGECLFVISSSNMDWKFGSRPNCKISFYIRISGAWPCKSLATDLFCWTSVFSPLLSCWSFLCSVVTIWVCSTSIRLTIYLMVSPKVEDNSVNFHFILFVNVDGHLYELGKVLWTVWTGLTLHCTAVLGAQARYFVLIKLLAEGLRAKTQFVSSSEDFNCCWLHWRPKAHCHWCSWKHCFHLTQTIDNLFWLPQCHHMYTCLGLLCFVLLIQKYFFHRWPYAISCEPWHELGWLAVEGKSSPLLLVSLKTRLIKSLIKRWEVCLWCIVAVPTCCTNLCLA